MTDVLLSWVGQADLDGMAEGNEATGPLIGSLQRGSYQTVELLSNYPSEETAAYIEGLKRHFPKMTVACKQVELPSGPTAYQEIFPAVDEFLADVTDRYRKQHITVNLSPGTPAMQAVWILLTKTRYPVAYIESYKVRNTEETVVKSVEIPFSLSVELSGQSKTRIASRFTQAAISKVAESADFGKIFGTSSEMQLAKRRAARLADLDVPTLILGETGTGKELFTKAIVNASSRKGKPIRTVNCGAIPAELIDSTLFGHKKGSFTGATDNREGLFSEADGGTVFLDEVGELPLDAQVRLLRVLQEGEVNPVGSSKVEKVDVRIIAATHRDLMEMVGKGQFRADLYYRLAVGVLELPPLRRRQGEIGDLADFLMAEINQELGDQPNFESKKISPDVKNIILKRRWPGNVRELRATLVRAAIWCETDTISVSEFEESSIKEASETSGGLLQELSQPIDIHELIGRLARFYIPQALEKCANNKTKAAKYIGLNSHQNLTQWIEKYGVEV